jgi:pyruvate/2-oxoglutarate dehydrogenase complex dihydrolipoamide dehydrogenase (E3) component
MQMADSSYDLVIIGGGTAGSSAAPRAAQLGLRVLLLEKQAGACLPVGVVPLFARDEHVLRRYLEVPLNALSFRGFLL